MEQFRRDKLKENEYNYYTSIAQPVASEPGLRPPIIPVVVPPSAAPVVPPIDVAQTPIEVAQTPIEVAPVVPQVPTKAELEEAEMMASAFGFLDG
jgi:hypothetical protein